MKVGLEIDSLLVELRRKGLQARYIVMGREQYRTWMEESGKRQPEIINEYMGCSIVICNSDVLEVVPEPKALYEYYLRER